MCLNGLTAPTSSGTLHAGETASSGKISRSRPRLYNTMPGAWIWTQISRRGKSGSVEADAQFRLVTMKSSTSEGMNNPFYHSEGGEVVSRPFEQGVVAFLGFGRRDVADGFQQPAIVKPIDPFQRSELDRLEGAPRPARSAAALGRVMQYVRCGRGRGRRGGRFLSVCPCGRRRAGHTRSDWYSLDAHHFR